MTIPLAASLSLLLGAAGCSQHTPTATPATTGGQAMAATGPAAPDPVSAPDSAVAQGDSTVARSASTPPRPPVEAFVPPDSPVRSGAYGRVSGQAILIPAGTRLDVRLAQTLDTRRSRAGERFFAYLDAPIVSGGRVIVPKGTRFEGRVIESKPSGRLKGRAYLGVRLDSFRFRGRTYRIATVADFRSSRPHKKRDIAIIGGSTGTGAAIGAIAGGGIGAAVGAGTGALAGTAGALITGRKNVRLPVETRLVFSLRGPVAMRG